jgi:hypothetical protein
MDNPTYLEVRQETLASMAESTISRVPALKMGLPIWANKWDLLALQGRMFNVKEGTIGTALTFSAAAEGGIVLTAPSFRFTVPTGTTVFPHKLGLALIPGATSVDNEIALLYTAADSYTSGGTAVTPLNWRTDQPRATAVTNCYHCSGSALVEAALTSVRVLHQEIYTPAAAFATSYNLNINKTVEFNHFVPIVGPASLLLFISAKTAAITGYFSFDWAEVPTTSAINAV